MSAHDAIVIGSRVAGASVAAERAAVRAIVVRGGHRLTGAHIRGPHADETIRLLALAVRHGLTSDEVRDVRFAYPTSTHDVGCLV
jgi:glutathione reductase (NADPH)